jgi:hypothetical protein
MQAEKEEALSAQQKVEELERQMEQLRAEEAEKLEHLKAEKEAQETAMQKQLASSSHRGAAANAEAVVETLVYDATSR